MIISEAYELYEEDKKLLNYSQYTLKAYRIQSNLLIRYLDDVNIKSIETINLKKYLISQKHLKPSSISHRIRFLKSFFRHLQEEGLLTNNPSSKLKEPKEGFRIPKFLTEEEIEFLRIGCKKTVDYALLEFLFSTGVRIGEAYNLKLTDINLENRSAIIQGKGNKQREIYFNLKCKIWLKKYLEQRKDKLSVDYVFITERKPYRRMSISQLRWITKRIARQSEININVYPHRYRHSYAMTLLNRRMPIEMIQSLLGHQKLETTKIYAQLSGQRRKEEYDRYSM